jgi:hypothetical protein
VLALLLAACGTAFERVDPSEADAQGDGAVNPTPEAAPDTDVTSAADASAADASAADALVRAEAAGSEASLLDAPRTTPHDATSNTDVNVNVDATANLDATIKTDAAVDARIIDAAPDLSAMRDQSNDVMRMADVSSEALATDVAVVPRSNLLDDFEREDGALGGRWTGDVGAFAIERGRLVVKQSGCYTLYFTGPDAHLTQEAHVTLKKVPEGVGELNLVLKARSAAGCEHIEVDYQPAKQLIGVFGCEYQDGAPTWTEAAAQKSADLAIDHVFKATVDESGNVRLYDNDVALASYVAPNWAESTVARGGLGLSFCDALGAELDDFGGVP